jgi:uncharacterized membrane protein
MRFRLALPVILATMALSAMVVLVAPSLLVDAEGLSNVDRPAVSPDAAVAMAFLAGFAGLATASAAGPLARWFPTGLVILGIVVAGVGVYLTAIALTQKPALAPMLIALHVMFVAAYGLGLPYLALRDYRRRHQVGRADAASGRGM